CLLCKRVHGIHGKSQRRVHLGDGGLGEADRSQLEEERGPVGDPDVRYRVAKLHHRSFNGQRASAIGDLLHSSATNGDDHRHAPLPLGQIPARPSTAPDSRHPGTTPDADGGGGSTAETSHANNWAATHVDPFISTLRRDLLRDRPADVPAYVSAFSTHWQQER
ncbi:unnamed protein product, partial [Ectocarpus sp. 13 AM-2016]